MGPDNVGQAGGLIKATVGGIRGEARARVIPPLPWKETFDSYAVGSLPPQWVSAQAGRFQVSELEGQKVLEKLPNDTLFKRIRIFMGPSDWSNYTVESDIRITEKRRQMGDAGIIAQRYTLVAFGNNQRLEMNSWQPEIARAVSAPFAWKPDTWYRLKLRVENTTDGQTRIRGKAWAVADPEPDGWLIDRVDPIPNKQGSPGLFADAQFGVYFDNIKVTPKPMKPRDPALFVALFATIWLLFASDPGSGDWPMWGGTPDRNMISSMKGIPTTWDLKTKKNVKWVAQLGSQSYGNPVVAGGQVYAGTNNELVRNPKETGDRGVLMCFRESDGKFLWQQANPKLAAGRALDWPFQGVCSSPLVEGDHLYYVTNRCELVCLDTHGDGNGGPKVIWKFDMIDEVGSSPHNMSNSSPVSYGDLVFAGTANGQDESHVHIPSPRAPSMIAVNKQTGKLVWEVNNVGERILHGQWSSPSVGKIGDVVQVVMGEGDGWVRGYEAATGKKLWEFDMNPKDAVWPKTRNEVIGHYRSFGTTRYTSPTGRTLSTGRELGTSMPSTPPSAAISL